MIRSGDSVGGRYRIIQGLGSGGMGTLFLVEDLTDSRPAVLKVVATSAGDDTSMQRRLEREREALQKLEHPNICRYLDWVKIDHSASGLVMEYIEGVDLKTYLSNRGSPLPLSAAIGMAVELFEALSEAHANSVIHRDIKPLNLMVRNGSLVVIDFGLSKLVGRSGITGDHEVFGSRGYMAPEQLCGITDERSDIFVAGIVLYELFCGTHPFPTTATATRDVATITPDFSKLPAEVATVVRCCLEKNPARRPPTASVVSYELRQIGNVSADPWEAQRQARRLWEAGDYERAHAVYEEARHGFERDRRWDRVFFNETWALRCLENLVQDSNGETCRRYEDYYIRFERWEKLLEAVFQGAAVADARKLLAWRQSWYALRHIRDVAAAREAGAYETAAIMIQSRLEQANTSVEARKALIAESSLVEIARELARPPRLRDLNAISELYDRAAGAVQGTANTYLALHAPWYRALALKNRAFALLNGPNPDIAIAENLLERAVRLLSGLEENFAPARAQRQYIRFLTASLRSSRGLQSYLGGDDGALTSAREAAYELYQIASAVYASGRSFDTGKFSSLVDIDLEALYVDTAIHVRAGNWAAVEAGLEAILEAYPAAHRRSWRYRNFEARYLAARAAYLGVDADAKSRRDLIEHAGRVQKTPCGNAAQQLLLATKTFLNLPSEASRAALIGNLTRLYAMDSRIETLFAEEIDPFLALPVDIYRILEHSQHPLTEEECSMAARRMVTTIRDFSAMLRESYGGTTADENLDRILANLEKLGSSVELNVSPAEYDVFYESAISQLRDAMYFWPVLVEVRDDTARLTGEGRLSVSSYPDWRHPIERILLKVREDDAPRSGWYYLQREFRKGLLTEYDTVRYGPLRPATRVAARGEGSVAPPSSKIGRPVEGDQ